MGYFTIPLPTTTQFSEHSRKKLYSLSKRFSPPRIDFLSTDYLDSGSTQPSTRLNNPHKTIEDVKTEELETFREFSFMTPGDPIFYLSPILDAHTKESSLEATDFLSILLSESLRTPKAFEQRRKRNTYPSPDIHIRVQLAGRSHHKRIIS